jgi:hypothetical protein
MQAGKKLKVFQDKLQLWKKWVEKDDYVDFSSVAGCSLKPEEAVEILPNSIRDQILTHLSTTKN